MRSQARLSEGDLLLAGCHGYDAVFSYASAHAGVSAWSLGPRPYTAGWRVCQSVAPWYACAARSTVASSNGRPDSRRLSGSPRPEKPAGTASDGSPVRLKAPV